jgi:hypothetical protein
MLVSAGLALLSAISAWAMIEGKPQKAGKLLKSAGTVVRRT